MANKKSEENNEVMTEQEVNDVVKEPIVEEVPEVEVKQPEELNLDQKVTVRNLAPWDVTFHRITDGGFGDVFIVGHGTYRLSRAEIIAQIQSGNQLFSGFNSTGKHATIYIDDQPTRIEVGFDSPDGNIKQRVIDDNTMKELFEYKTQSTFEKHFTDLVKTRAEKFAAMEIINKLKLNDFNKIRFAEGYTNIKI